MSALTNIGPGGPPFSISEWPAPDLNVSDFTIGGRAFMSDDPKGDQVGHMVTFRGESERRYLRKRMHLDNLGVYYGGSGVCWGMGV